MDGRELLAGRYEVGDLLGFGGMAEVRDGWDTRLERAVAIKLLHPGLSSRADVRARFQVEACAAAALNHPNIVAVYDFGDQGDKPFIVMERLPGDTLGDQLASGPLPQAHVHAVLSSVLAALAAAHGAGILHRDIKPGNILPTRSGAVKVADFGIAKSPHGVHTTTGELVGTLAYLSPDRLAGKPATVADDLYAAGVVGYEALTGRKPYPQEDIVALAHAITEEAPPPLAQLRPDVDPALAEVIARAMSRAPAHRFPSADAMLASWNGLAGHQFSGQPSTLIGPGLPATGVAVAPLAAPRRRPWPRIGKVAAAAATLAAMALAVLALGADPVSTTPPPESVGIRTSEPAPITATAVSSTTSSTTELPPPAPSPVLEQATNVNDGGNGHGHNGNGRKKPK